MLFIESKNTYLEDALFRLGDKLQLDKTRRNQLEISYGSITEWLQGIEIFKDIQLEIYPHGSVAIGTTTKPLAGEEFDLDCVLQINTDYSRFSPEFILRVIAERMRSHEVYKSMLVLKNRCIRLIYKGDYHVDIMPGFPIIRIGGDLLKVPDREARDWVDSGPKPYVKWFRDKFITVISPIKKSLFEASIEPLPEEPDYEVKQPLQIAVQLLKRNRDIFFKDDGDKAPRSIILTTLAGLHYSGQQSVTDTLTTIINGVKQQIHDNNNFPFLVLNPANPKENFSEEWQNVNMFRSFTKFIDEFDKNWSLVKDQENIIQASGTLETMFGETTRIVFAEQGAYINRLKDQERIRVKKDDRMLTSIIAPVATTVKHFKNTNFGD